MAHEVRKVSQTVAGSALTAAGGWPLYDKLINQENISTPGMWLILMLLGIVVAIAPWTRRG